MVESSVILCHVFLMQFSLLSKQNKFWAPTIYKEKYLLRSLTAQEKWNHLHADQLPVSLAIAVLFMLLPGPIFHGKWLDNDTKEADKPLWKQNNSRWHCFFRLLLWQRLSGISILCCCFHYSLGLWGRTQNHITHFYSKLDTRPCWIHTNVHKSRI